MQDLKRVFFHELGHFIAHEVNQRNYNGTGTNMILFTPVGNTGLFEGEAKINLSEDERERRAPLRDMLCTYLAASSYGCIFQAYYMNQELDDCFKHNGEVDIRQWHGSLDANGLSIYSAEVSILEKEYFQLLKDNEELKLIMQLNPERYIIDDGQLYYHVNMDLLREETLSFIEAHQEVYKQLVERYEDLIAKCELEK